MNLRADGCALTLLSLTLSLATSNAASAQTTVTAVSEPNIGEMRQALAAERVELDRQQKVLEAQRARIESLEARLGIANTHAATGTETTVSPGGVPLPASPPPAPPTAVAQSAPNLGNGVQSVGSAPVDQRQVQVAVLSEQGGIITKAGQLTLEGDLEYARSDRSDVVFRGVQIPEAVLIGVFDINQSRQDVLTACRAALRSTVEFRSYIDLTSR